ncbi:hypothetical protein VKT23_008136 [Stygiomarasmius scandens]|uniref:C2H2-type domain-containing protein n=1 Tax=Marasmiellus scandens TaxID=2682957 RepID=A0ABR1JJM5_9AGAR
MSKNPAATTGYPCEGCNIVFNRQCDLNQHHLGTGKRACQDAANTAIARIRASRFKPKKRRPRKSSPRTSRPPSPTAPVGDTNNAAEDAPQAFVGDFFGNDYDAEDFPGFDNSAVHSETEDPANEDPANDDELEQTWEPPHHPVQAAPDPMDIDEPLPPTRTVNPLLPHLPAHRDGIHVVTFGGHAGEAVSDSASQSFHNPKWGFEAYGSKITGSSENLWAPFASKMDWEVARWAKMRGTGSTAFSDLLAIEGVAEALALSYQNSKQLNHIIDHGLPTRRPAFTRQEVVIAGKAYDFYVRDVLDCIKALYGNPDHTQYLAFTPERHYADADHTMRLYHDLNTGKWWWDMQKAIEKDKPGATIIPLIISSDKTQITLFRNKSAYLTIGNLPKEIRRKPSQQGQILLAYLPTSRLEHITNKAARRRTVTNLFHACMKDLLAPLKDAGLEGVNMKSGDGVIRRCHPIVAAYVGDYPEQILVTTAYYGDCPTCECPKDQLGVYPCTHAYRDFEAACDAAEKLGSVDWVSSCQDANLKPVQHPFWEDLPYTDIFHSITPDILHQLYQGVMKHLISWLTTVAGADEIDARVRRLPPNHGIRVFHKGITTLSRVSGTEHKQMCSFLLGVVIDIPGLTSRQSNSLLSATRALLDFLYLSCYPIHSDESLTLLEQSLETFHENREIFVELGARENFNLPKLHFLCHYRRAIKFYGTSDNYNTETTERLHIDFAKDAYRASNRKDEYTQMTQWLERREKITAHTKYIAWRCGEFGGLDSDDDEDDDEDDVPDARSDVAARRLGQRLDFPGAQRTVSDLRCMYTQKLSRFPTVKFIRFSKLQDGGERGYRATDFVMALKRFVVQFREPYLPANQLDDYARFVVLPFHSVPVWHKLKFVNYELFGKKTLDSICAHPRRYNNKGKVTQSARFDTALIKLKGLGNSDGDGDNFLKESRVGRIRVIFSLPQGKLDTLFAVNSMPPKHLAYVEWFSKFNQRADPYSGLHTVKRQTASGTITSAVIPVEMLQRSVHLIPKWDGMVPSEWSSESVLDDCSTFLLNVFKDEHTYFNLT